LRRAALAAAAILASLPARADGPSLPHAAVVLQGLDKVTARISELRADVGKPLRFGTLEVTARACVKAPPIEPPESAAFLEIRDTGPASDGALVFSGWMFASTPALSALEHPVYDVWVLDCAEPLPEPEPLPTSSGQNG
jgi:hypothetical protein